MMREKGDRAVQKDQSSDHHLISDSSSDTFFSPTALAQKASNTIPVQLMGFSSSFRSSLRSSGHDGKPRPWDNSRVGLALVDSLFAETKSCGMSSSGFSDSRKYILLRSQLRANTSSPMSQIGARRDDASRAVSMSLPKEFGVSSRAQAISPGTHLGCSKMAVVSQGVESEFTYVSGSLPLAGFTYHNPEPCSEVFSSDSSSTLDSPRLVPGDANLLRAFTGSAHSSITCLSPSEIEQSEDYTCVITHGSNPKMVHIFGDRILGSGNIQKKDFVNEPRKEISPACLLKPVEASPVRQPGYFLRFCYSCNRKLREGEDIYMYRGDEAFCSIECRHLEMLIEEEMERPKTISSRCSGSCSDDYIFPDGMFIPP